MTFPRCNNPHITIKPDGASCDCCLHFWNVPGGPPRVKCLWLLTAALLAWCLVVGLCGCATNKAESRKQKAVIQRAPVPVTLADIPQRSVARAVVSSPLSVVQSPMPPVTLAWDYDSSRRWEVAHFRVYSNTILTPAPWPLWVTTTNQFISFLPTNTSRFFYCTAFGVNGTESLPNTK